MNKIKFSHNWNDKLNHDIFTTIRRSTKEKEEYYDNLIGSELEIVLQEKVIGIAKLIDVDEIRFIDIPLGLLFVDTGYTDVLGVKNLFQKFGINEMTKVLILTFERTK